MTSRQINGLFVDNDEILRSQYIENITLAIAEVCEIDVNWEAVDRIEEAKRVLRKYQTKYQLIVVDLLWDAIGPAQGGRDSRGLEVVAQAAKTPGVVIVALSVGDTLNFPSLPEQAREAGAHIFRIRGALQSAARVGSWDRLAEDICQALTREMDTERRQEKVDPERVQPNVVRQSVFVVCGRNSRMNNAVFALLRSLGLRPYEWEQVVTLAIAARRSGGNPNTFDVVEHGFEVAQGVIVLFTPDDETQLKLDLRKSSDPDFESRLTGQARPNVLLEAGYALRHDREHTLILSIGVTRPISDLSGMHLLHFDGSATARKTLAERLRALGLAVDTTGDDWLVAGNFS